jgi:type I restriction enzyme S subunit
MSNHPSDWKIETIGDVCEIHDSKRIPLSGEQRRERKGPYPYYGANNIQDSINDFIFDFNAVLLAEDGGYYDDYETRDIAQYATGKYWVNNHAHILTGRDRLDTKFLYYALVRKNICPWINTGTRAKLNQADMRQIEIAVPPLPEQKKIAEILSGIDRTITQTGQRIEKHKTLLWAAVEQILDALGGKAYFAPLGDCCRHILDFRGRTPAKLGMEWGGGRIRALSANNVRDGFIDFNRECYLGSESLYRNWMTRGDCTRGDIIFTMEAPMGNVAIIPDDEKYILSQRVVLLSPDRQQILPEYLYWFMRSSRFRSDCENLATGTTAKGIKQANLITISVPIATLEEQAKAVQSPTAIERLISSEEQRLSQLYLIKQSLSADLLSGRKRVSV